MAKVKEMMGHVSSFGKCRHEEQNHADSMKGTMPDDIREMLHSLKA